MMAEGSASRHDNLAMTTATTGKQSRQVRGNASIRGALDKGVAGELSVANRFAAGLANLHLIIDVPQFGYVFETLAFCPCST